MSLVPKGRFVPEARRAGWISAAASFLLAVLLAWAAQLCTGCV